MRALVYGRFGGADGLQLRELPVPVPGHGELVVKVIAAALNPIDWKIMRGDLKFLSGRRFTFAHRRMPNYTLLEYICEDNREYIDEKGLQRMRLGGSAPAR